MSEFKTLISTCETLLREGKGHAAVQLLNEMEIAKIPRSLRVPLANICRRTNLLSLGLKILSPLTEDSAPAERAEYAILLERAGASREALSILKRIDPKDVPEISLYRSFCMFKSWDYTAAIPELEAHIERMQAPYAKLVGKVNLAAAFVIDENFDKALAQIDENIAIAERDGYARLRANCLELKAQVLIRQNALKEAHQTLAAAAAILEKEETVESFFIRKWRAVAGALETQNPAPLAMIRAEALRRRDWESVREADLFRLQVEFDEGLFRHLYFGTPYNAYHKRIRTLLGRAPQEDHYIHGDSQGPVLDLATGNIDDRKPAVPLSQISHKTLAALLRDFYRPLTVAELFAGIFPDEHFDIHSSPGRVHQLQFRLRQWLMDSQLPVKLVEDRKVYSLAIEGRFGFRVPLEPLEVDGWWPQWRMLKDQLEGRTFRSADVRRTLDLKPTSCKRFLNWAIANGLLERETASDSKSWSLKIAG